MSGFLASLLRVERVGERAFAARLHGYQGGASFGGDVLARATLAASMTCEDKALHALHATFLRPVAGGAAIELEVEALADGRRLARRRVEVRHAGRRIVEAIASFANAGGPGWQEATPPDVPDPDALPEDREVARAEGWRNWNLDQEEFAWRFVGRPYDPRDGAGDSRWSAWLRPRQPLPDDPRVHAAAVAFLSDYSSQWSAARKLGRPLDAGFVSLDQVVRIHRPVAWTDWWLSHAWSEVAHAGRTLWHRQLFDRGGALIASVSQEGMLLEDAGT